MPATILSHARIVKDKLIDFAHKEFEAEFKRLSKELYPDKKTLSDDELTVFTDWFILEHLIKDNKTILQFFIENSREDADVLVASQWKYVIQGVFQVKKIVSKNHIQLYNLVNEVFYNVTSTMKEELPLKKGEYILAKILPLENYHIFSGLIDKIETRKKEEIYKIVAEIQLHDPKMAFIDNPQRLEQAYNIQKDEYKDFMSFFGSDEVIMSGQELAQKLREFYHYRYFQKKDLQGGHSIAKTFQEKYHQLPQLPIFDFFHQLHSREDIGVIYDQQEGILFLSQYGKFKEIFSRSDFKQIKNYKKVIKGYLKDPTISALPFKRVAKEFPENSLEVFKAFLNRKRFTLEKDFPKLIEKYKPNAEINHLTPSIVPMLVKSKMYLKSLKINKNDPCPCGSQKKYRLCCGAL